MSVAGATAIDRISSSRDDEPLFEVINGEIVELPPKSYHSAKITSRLASKVGNYAEATVSGEAAIEALFRIPLEKDPYRNRRPSAAYVSYQRWPRGKPESYFDDAWDVVPDLAIEVISPNDRVEELMEKLTEYFAVNVRTVWVVFPLGRIVHVYDSLDSIRVLQIDDTLDGGSVLPGFRLPLREIFVAQAIDDREPISNE